MPEYAVHVITDATAVTDDQLDQLVDGLSDIAAVPSMLDGRLSVQVTVDSAELAAAPVAAVTHLRQAMATAGLAGDPVSAHAMTAQEFAAWLANPARPGLVPTAVAAKMLGISRQAMLLLPKRNPKAPQPVKIGRDLQWPTAELRTFERLHRRRPGRPSRTEER